ncbi:isopiperitenol/carveol dehydrogenase [Salix suchowensis]|nr:isopiperitenol/carveol dehydrogenase [Salix suchowensis]
MESGVSTKKVQDKVAIVTGGASGIGEATVLAFVENGARGVVIADIQDVKGQKLAESIGTNRSTYIHCDVTDENQVKSLVESTVQLYGQLDVIFCNAGVLSFGQQTVLDLDLDSYDKLFAVNVRGVAACLKHAARAMVEGGVKGSIICTASTVVNLCGVVALMKCASYQLGKHGIRVNCVSPGPVATPMVCEANNMGAEEVEKFYESSYCLKGVMKAKHVADAVLFLASEDSEFVTGQNLVVDGGYGFQGAVD